MNKIDFRQLSKPVITEGISNNNTQSKKTQLVYSNILEGINFVNIFEKVEDKTGKVRSRKNFYKINNVGVCKRVFLDKLNQISK